MEQHTYLNNLLAFLAGYYGETNSVEQTIPAPEPLHYAMIPAGVALVLTGLSALRRGTMKS